MQGRCDNNPLDQAEDVCNECGGEFCSACLVYPRGQKKPPVCKACAILKSGVRMSGRSEQWETANRKGIRKRRKSVQAAAAAEPQEQLFRFFDEDGSDVEVRDRESLAALAEDTDDTEKAAPKKGRRWRRKDDKPAGEGDAQADQLTSVPVPDDAEEPTSMPLATGGDGVDVDDFLAEEPKPKRGFRRRADDHTDADSAAGNGDGDADHDEPVSDDADEQPVDIGAALSIIQDAAASHEVPEAAPAAAGIDAPSTTPTTTTPAPTRSSPRATELLSKLREAGGEVAAVEPQPVPIPDDPFTAATTAAPTVDQGAESDPFFDQPTAPTHDDAFEPVASPTVEPDPFAPAGMDPFVPAEPLPAPTVEPMTAPPAQSAEPDPFAISAFETGPDAIHGDDPFASPAPSSPATVDPFHSEPPAAAPEPAAFEPTPEPAAFETMPETVVFEPAAESPFETMPETVVFEPAAESPFEEPAPTPEPIVESPPAQAAEHESSPTNPPPGAADRDADGNWIPPVLRGMAPVQERQALPKRRGG